jgi:hypothetical protein
MTEQVGCRPHRYGRVAAARVTELQRWCRLTLRDPAGRVIAERVLEGRGGPDLAAVDELAHWALAAVRLGWAMSLSETSSELAALLGLSGLDHLLGSRPTPASPEAGTEAGTGAGTTSGP